MIKRKKFIKNFLSVAENRLNERLPVEETEGEMLITALRIVEDHLKHILSAKEGSKKNA